MSTVIFLPLFFGTVLESANSKKNAGDELTSSLDTANRHPKKPPSRELEKDGRRADSSADSKKELGFSARFFFVVVGRALREKSRLGERIVIDRFFVCVFANCTF